jgi:tetratricopeptide (TPR) repeat protein
MGRDNFSKDIKRKLAERVGYICSNPECSSHTVGPSAESNEAIYNIGVAAHICAASAGGPRYDNNMSSDERKSINNGIWLCQICAKLIDDDVVTYTKELLHGWKHKTEIIAVEQLKSSRSAVLKLKLAKIVTIDSAPPPSEHFIGRWVELANIKSYIEQNKRLMLVNGMGGIGKSEVCKNLFNYYSKTNTQIEYIGWVGFNENIKKTLYGKFNKTRKFTGLEENFIKTKEYINELSSRLLLFIDNMNEIIPEDRDVLASLHCNIVITSRQMKKFTDMKSIKIGELPEEDCIKLYKDFLERDSYNDEIVRQIVRKAACLTIVVELLAKTANRVPLTDEKFLEKLDKKGFDLSEIKHKIDKDKKFNECLSSLFDLSKINNDERTILKQFSLFPPQSVPFEYAHKWFGQDNPDALNDLSDKGWLIRTDIGFYMHHVISDVVKYENKPTYNECNRLVNVLGENLYYGVTEIFTSRLPLLPFGESVAQHFTEVENEGISYLLYSIARLYNEQGYYSKALKYYGSALMICEKVFNKEHPSIAAIYNNMANIYRKQGDYNNALKYSNYTLECAKKVLGEKDSRTATAYNNMALILHARGDYDKALEYYGYALSVFEEELDKKHPDTATTYNNIALTFNEQGNYDKALEYYDCALSIDEKALCKEHPRVATTYNNIALVFHNQNDYDKALEWYLRSYKIRLDKLGAKHSDTVMCLNNMKYVFNLSGKRGHFETWLNKQLGLIAL